MRSDSREEIVEVFDALEADLKRALDLSFDVLTTPECLAMLERCETIRRRLPAVEHPLINQLAEQANDTELGGTLRFALAERLRITPAEASRRIHEAADLGDRQALTGEPLAPRLPATAAAQRGGQIGTAHVAVIRSFMHRLPGFVDAETREHAEAHLAELAGQHRPDDLAMLAQRLTDCLNPDGDFTDDDRARRRGLTLGKQGPDLMSHLSGWITPELRATLEAVWAKLAAPGMCNRRFGTDCRRHTLRGDSPPRHPQHRAAQPRRPARGAAGVVGLRKPRAAQRATGQHHRHHQPQRPRSRHRTRPHRRRNTATDVRCDPAGLPRPPLPSHFRQRQSASAVSHQTLSLARPTNRALCEGPRVHVPELPRTRLSLRSPPLHPLRPMPHHRRQRPHPRLRRPPPHHRRRLDHPQTEKRRHRMDTTPTPRPRPTPHQPIPPPRKAP